MKVYDPREYEPATELFKAARIKPSSHLRAFRITFSVVLFIAIAMILIGGWPR